MRHLTEEAIKGAMLHRGCSREEAITWLTGPVTEDELREFKESKELDLLLNSALAKHLGIHDDETIKEHILNGRFWDADMAPFLDGVRRSQIITGKDMSIRVGPC